jgi:hypothetical protein
MRKIRAKNLHTWNRRGFSVASAGYFTVLKPTGWFAASRLPGGFRYVGGQAKAIASPQDHKNSVGNPTAAHQDGWTSVPEEWSTQEHWSFWEQLRSHQFCCGGLPSPGSTRGLRPRRHRRLGKYYGLLSCKGRTGRNALTCPSQ